MASPIKKVYTITYGDVAENHARMQKIGQLHAEGYSLATLEAVQKRLLGEGIVSDLIPLHEVLLEEDRKEEAYVLVIRKGV